MSTKIKYNGTSTTSSARRQIIIKSLSRLVVKANKNPIRTFYPDVDRIEGTINKKEYVDESRDAWVETMRKTVFNSSTERSFKNSILKQITKTAEQLLDNFDITK